MNADTRFFEYRYSHEEKKTETDEQQFFDEMYHLHRASRDPTYENPSHLRDLAALYIFPYGSEILRRSPNDWEKILPVPVRDDIHTFFQELWKKGTRTAFLQCADGKHVECKLVRDVK